MRVARIDAASAGEVRPISNTSGGRTTPGKFTSHSAAILPPIPARSDLRELDLTYRGRSPRDRSRSQPPGDRPEGPAGLEPNERGAVGALSPLPRARSHRPPAPAA